MDRVLLLGGGGYLGSVLVGHLLQRGYQVTVLDNLMYGQTSLLHHCKNPEFRFVCGDVRDETMMRGLVSKHDAVLPLAAIVGQPACDRDPVRAQAVNLDSIILLARLLSPTQQVVFPCTNSGYGTQSGEQYCTEETPLEPVSFYGITKVKAEREVLRLPNAISLRLATVFGVSPRMRLDLLVNDFVYRAATDGYLVVYEKDFKRNYVHIDDVSDCFCFCLEHFEELKGEAYNVGLDEANLSKEELALKVKEHVPATHVHFADVGKDPDRRNYIVSNEKIRRKGFVASRSLDEGIEQLLKAYRMLPNGPFTNA